MTASGGLAKCSTCAAGFYANMDPGLTGPLTNGTPGATSCLACPVGTFSFPSSAGVEDCIKCPINTTADRVGMKACDTCPVGYHTCSFGSTKCTLIPCTTPPAPPPHYPVLPRPSHASPAYGSYGSPIWDGPSSSPPSSNMVSRGTLCKSNTSLASSTPLLMIMRIPVKLVSYDITSFLWWTCSTLWIYTFLACKAPVGYACAAGTATSTVAGTCTAAFCDTANGYTGTAAGIPTCSVDGGQFTGLSGCTIAAG